MNTVYLSRRNLETLLDMLNNKDPDSGSMIIKNDTTHDKYPCSDRTIVVAVEDVEYYVNRMPGV